MARVRDRLGTIAIVVLVILDVVLVTYAFRHSNPPIPERSGAQHTAPAAAPSPVAEATTPATPTVPPNAESAAGPTYLSLAPDGTLLRSTRGSCTDGEPPTLAVSTDDGATFTPLPVADELAEVVRVQADAVDELWLVGAGADCEPVVYRGAATGPWTPEPDTVWHLPLDDAATTVHTPDGPVDVPCPPVSLTLVERGGPRVLCGSGAVLGSSDAGATWVTLGRLRGGVAIDYLTPGDGYGVSARRGCPAALVRTTDGGADWERLACLDGGPARAVSARTLDGATGEGTGDVAVAALAGSTVTVRAE